jgi:hypothetical protein
VGLESSVIHVKAMYPSKQIVVIAGHRKWKSQHAKRTGDCAVCDESGTYLIVYQPSL